MRDSEGQAVQKRGVFMVTITLHCPHCESDALIRNGHAPNGKQLYRCHGCGRQSRENPTPHAYPESRREEILHARPRTKQSTWPHSHVWRLSHHGVKLDQKKGVQLPPLHTTLVGQLASEWQKEKERG